MPIDFLFGNITSVSLCLTSFVLQTFLKFKNRNYCLTGLPLYPLLPPHLSLLSSASVPWHIHAAVSWPGVPFLSHLVYVISSFVSEGHDFAKGGPLESHVGFTVCL